jgi:enamine deaminase RidA (YjgF/YER057c/UK114 family)
VSFEKRIQELHIDLPEVAAVGNYAPAVKTGRLVYVSGQLPKAEGRLTHTGRVGRELGLEEGRRAARTCAINALAALKSAVGSLDKVQRIVKLTGYVTSSVGFQDHHKVIDAASDLLVEIFGPAGKHARAVVGVVELPMGAPVEIELIAEV